MVGLCRDNAALICIICKTTPFNGNYGGLLINSKLICSTCEMRIILTPVDDQYYMDFKEELKAVWHNC